MMIPKANVGDVKRLSLFFLFLLLVILISGCSENTEKQINKVPITIDQCISIICEDNEVCFNGECECNEGFNRCNGECIPDSSCCTNEDCELSYFCNENNACEEGCNDFLCESNLICDDSTQDCVCEPGTKWCDKQNKCIREDSCCTNLNCPEERGCVMTISFVTLCIDSDGTIGCEKVLEGQEKKIYINENKYKLFVKRIFEDDRMILSLNDDPIRFNTNDEYEIDSNTIMYAKLVKRFGGTCDL